jgi:predicted DNA-binding protein (MmcQ/YjbR family)
MEKISHGEPTWFAGPKGKVFAMFDNHHHSSPHVAVWLPTPPEVQSMLVASNPKAYFVPPYVGPKGWTGVVLDTEPDWSSVESLIRESYLAVARRPPSKPRGKR